MWMILKPARDNTLERHTIFLWNHDPSKIDATVSMITFMITAIVALSERKCKIIIGFMLYRFIVAQ